MQTDLAVLGLEHLGGLFLFEDESYESLIDDPRRLADVQLEWLRLWDEKTTRARTAGESGAWRIIHIVELENDHTS